LSLMRDRIEILHSLLSNDGTLAIHIDDNELGYLIALCDEIFGRSNRQSVVTFKQSSVSGPKSVNPGIVTIANYIVIYAKDKTNWNPNRVLKPVPRDKRYSKYIANYEDNYSRWRLIGLRDALALEHGLPKDELSDRFGDDLEDAFDSFVIRNAG